MASRRSRHNSSSPSREVTTPFNPFPKFSTPKIGLGGYLDYRPVQDRRLFSPDPYRSPKTVLGLLNPVKAARQVKNTPHRLAFRFVAPYRALICVRRQARKEVLHALGLVKKGRGRSGAKLKRPRRNDWSAISCKG